MCILRFIGPSQPYAPGLPLPLPFSPLPAECRIPIPGFKEFGVGDHESHPTPSMLKELGFKHGVVTTGSSFDHTTTDDAMMAQNGEERPKLFWSLVCVSDCRTCEGGRERGSNSSLLEVVFGRRDSLYQVRQIWALPALSAEAG